MRVALSDSPCKRPRLRSGRDANGAGGAARGVIAGLIDAGARDICILNRTQARADVLAADLGQEAAIRVTGWESRTEVLAGAVLLVNTTSLGMTGAGALDLSLDALPAAAALVVHNHRALR